MVKISAIIVARNEEKLLPKTLDSLVNQTLKLHKIILVDDGSIDRTAEIAKKYGCIVVRLPYHEESYVGRPELAERFNRGLELIDEEDYVLIMGADHVLPKNYVEEIVKKMEADPSLVIAGGHIKGEFYDETAVRGSGRVVRVSFWKKVNGLRYPVCWGWESWLIFKAMQLGYKVRCFREITSIVLRKTSLRKAGYYGKAMYALGYHWKYALGRSLITFIHSPREGLKMLWNYLTHKDVKRLDIAGYVYNLQTQMFWKKVKHIILRRGAI